MFLVVRVSKKSKENRNDERNFNDKLKWNVEKKIFFTLLLTTFK